MVSGWIHRIHLTCRKGYGADEIRSVLKLNSGGRFLLLRFRPHTVLSLIIDPEHTHSGECTSFTSTSEEVPVSTTPQ